MSTKYLGKTFDIHGGGMDLVFPHHEAEIAQSTAAHGHGSANYWMHNNMITIEGQKMGKSLGNSISLDELFTGNHKLLEQAYSPMTIRFFILQAHYRSTLDFSNEALKAAEKGLDRLMKAIETLEKIKTSTESTVTVEPLKDKCYAALDDDFNTPILIAHLFDGVKTINSIAAGTEKINVSELAELKQLFNDFAFDILGLATEQKQKQKAADDDLASNLVNLLLNMRMEAKKNKDFAASDNIRNQLTAMGIVIKDTKEGFEWEKL
jgi:cysteinyl-tRNA synthetase